MATMPAPHIWNENKLYLESDEMLKNVESIIGDLRSRVEMQQKYDIISFVCVSLIQPPFALFFLFQT